MRKILLLFSLFCIVACSKEAEPELKPKLTQFQYTLAHGNNANIVGENLTGLTWISDYNFVATTSGGIINAHYVGEATITNLDHNFNIKVIVEPQVRLFHNNSTSKYLNVNWGVSKSSIKSQFPEAVNTNGYLGVNTQDKAVPAILYHFTKDKLDYYAMGVDLSSGEKLVDYLAERYAPLAQVDTYDFTFVHRDNKDKEDVLVYVSISTSLITVMFVPVSTKTKSAEPKIDEIAKILERVKLR
jgi:hypothetical protein